MEDFNDTIEVQEEHINEEVHEGSIEDQVC